MSTLGRAIAIATEVHRGQVDKGGSPYIEHPLRVMGQVHGEEVKIVAVLHDVIEDSSDHGTQAWTVERLREEGFSEAICAGVDAVTRRAGEPYMTFIRRAAENAIGWQVKMADLADNSDLARIPNPTKRDHARLQRYREARALLLTLGTRRAAQPPG
jgi:(p)ppGpp synthase/HD superfamily hydrolase